ncbi:hypothetical protein BDV18DRAFT_160357 [Aspergillus unguis]
MSSETCQVPIMIDLDGMNYEDIAKLNPFYEEYKTFWDPRSASDASLTDGLSNSPSLPSIISSSEYPSTPTDMATSPLIRDAVHPCSYAPQSPRIIYHSGGQYRPTYDEHYGLESSQVAIVDDEYIRRPLSPVHESTETSFESDAVDQALGNVRSSHKQLFGSNGWLGCTEELATPKKLKYKPSLRGLGKKFKQHVEDVKQHVEEVAADLAKGHPLPFHTRQPKVLSNPTAAISLDAAAQAKLYSEMEMMICVSANQFLVQQHADGRISKESIKKINNFWGSKNRPNVVEFQFDQATQRQLILNNIKTLHFNGDSSTNPVALHSNLHNWKAVVKEMSVRTFCAPDSVIRKHMHDIQKLLDMLGAPVATFLAFEELQAQTLVWMKEQRAKRYLADGGRTISPRTSYSSRSQ